jgi:hypothetical protein
MSTSQEGTPLPGYPNSNFDFEFATHRLMPQSKEPSSTIKPEPFLFLDLQGAIAISTPERCPPLELSGSTIKASGGRPGTAKSGPIIKSNP